ncbi:MAG TPA: carboxylate--amine ligase [Acidimicrobiaceae bacterium]|nr:carboxylate--amine ligase [Acidimicrobiaceae bacterium]|tara:strand:- start:94 stop:786 length:693 start_codon:yes stop_codon:yes gene_type:complete
MVTISEAASRTTVTNAGVVVSDWATAPDPEEAVVAAKTIGFPVAVKLCGDAIAHKTERGLLRLGIDSAEEVRAAGIELLEAARPEDGSVELLITAMARGDRELIAGLVRDPQFGPCVMLGVGGILAEVFADVAFRLAPLGRKEAHDLLNDLSAQALLGPFRGQPAVDREALVDTICALSDLADDPDLVSIDLNPLIVVEGQPIAVDVLVERRHLPSSGTFETAATSGDPN